MNVQKAAYLVNNRCEVNLIDADKLFGHLIQKHTTYCFYTQPHCEINWTRADKCLNHRNTPPI